MVFLSHYTSYVTVQSENGVNYSALNGLLINHWIDGFLKTQFQVECCQLNISNVTSSVHEMAALKVKIEVMQSSTNEIHPKPYPSVTFNSQRGKI